MSEKETKPVDDNRLYESAETREKEDKTSREQAEEEFQGIQEEQKQARKEHREFHHTVASRIGKIAYKVGKTEVKIGKAVYKGIKQAAKSQTAKNIARNTGRMARDEDADPFGGISGARRRTQPQRPNPLLDFRQTTASKPFNILGLPSKKKKKKGQKEWSPF